jgi:hypothetical protein
MAAGQTGIARTGYTNRVLEHPHSGRWGVPVIESENR